MSKTSLKTTRTEFKKLLLDTSFIGTNIDNRKNRQRQVAATLGPVQSPTDFGRAHQNARILAVVKMRECCQVWARLHAGDPHLYSEPEKWKTLNDYQHHVKRALVLNVADSAAVNKLEIGKLHSTPVAKRILMLERSHAQSGDLGALIHQQKIQLFGTEDQNVDTPCSFLIMSRDEFEQSQSWPFPFTFNWYWHDDEEQLSVDCSANLKNRYTVVPIKLEL